MSLFVLSSQKGVALIDSQEFSELDVLPEFKAFTGDVISRTAFGSRGSLHFSPRSFNHSLEILLTSGEGEVEGFDR